MDEISPSRKSRTLWLTAGETTMSFFYLPVGIPTVFNYMLFVVVKQNCLNEVGHPKILRLAESETWRFKPKSDCCLYAGKVREDSKVLFSQEEISQAPHECQQQRILCAWHVKEILPSQVGD